MDVIRWGIVGTGSIANSFARDAKFVSSAHLQAVVSRTQARADEFAAAHQIPSAYKDVSRLFADPMVDAVYIATPHHLHASGTIGALRAGKAVLCEKPMTVNLAEFREVERVALETETYLMEGMWTYFLPAVKRAHEWLVAGRIGRLCHIRADFGFNVPYAPMTRMHSPDLSGGTLLDMGIYPIALAWLAMKRPPLAVQVVGRRAATGVDDDVTVLCDYGGVTAMLSSSMRCRLSNAAQWVGTEGTIVLPDFWHASECLLLQGGETVDHFREARTHVGLSYELEAVCQDLLAGRRSSDVVPLASSQAFVEQLDLISSFIGS